MIRALSTAATGLVAQQNNIENISHDLANVNTDGYKRSRSEFSDLMYETIKKAGGRLGQNSVTPVGIQTGMGVKVGAAHKIHEQGPARTTYHPYDLMIEGPGFFQVQLPNGDIGYTRNGRFKMDAEGVLQLSTGAKLIPNITVPTNALGVKITGAGEIRAMLPGQNIAVLGQLELARFANIEGLESQGNGVFYSNPGSGQAATGIPGENGMGLIQQGALEGSNVNVANSMVDMITTQRAYEMNTRVMGVADKMLEATVNIR